MIHVSVLTSLLDCLERPTAPQSSVWSDPCCSVVSPIAFIGSTVSLVQWYVSLGIVPAFPWPPRGHVSSQLASFMPFIRVRQTDYDWTDVATVKIPLITFSLHWHCTFVSVVRDGVTDHSFIYVLTCSKSQSRVAFFILFYFIISPHWRARLLTSFLWCHFLPALSLLRVPAASNLFPCQKTTQSSQTGHTQPLTEPCLCSPAVDWGEVWGRRGSPELAASFYTTRAHCQLLIKTCIDPDGWGGRTTVGVSSARHAGGLVAVRACVCVCKCV